MCRIFKYVRVWGRVPNVKTNLKSVLGADVCKNLKFGIHVRRLPNLQVCSKCAPPMAPDLEDSHDHEGGFHHMS